MTGYPTSGACRHSRRRAFSLIHGLGIILAVVVLLALFLPVFHT